MVKRNVWFPATNVVGAVSSSLTLPFCPLLNVINSGHPTCMELRKIVDVWSYPWKCVECKACEHCQEKGDEVSLFVSYIMDYLTR